MNAEIECRSCGGRARRWGRGARGRRFAGLQLVPALDGGGLYRCTQCDLLLRHPLLPAEDYQALYARAPGGHWAAAELRPEQQRVVDHIRARRPQGGAVLDIGCASGDLLAALGPGFTAFGIEPSRDAQALAQSRGVRILGATPSELAAAGRRFDVITAIDVIEHVPDPRAFLAQLAPFLEAGGFIVISTGSTASAAWRLAGPAYYYSHNFEHISFISPRWCQRSAGPHFQGTLIEAGFAHLDSGGLPPGRRLKGWLRFGAKLLPAWFEQQVLTKLPGVARASGPRLMVGEPGLFRDHLMAEFALREGGLSSPPA